MVFVAVAEREKERKRAHPRSTTTANTHRTAESSSILQMNPRCHGVFARAACRRSVLATWTLIHPPGTHPDPQDPRQPQSLSTLRKPRQISKRTFDAMACSPAQHVVALSQSLEPRFETMPGPTPAALSPPSEPRSGHFKQLPAHLYGGQRTEYRKIIRLQQTQQSDQLCYERLIETLHAITCSALI